MNFSLTRILDRMTMYRVVLFALFGMLLWALILATFGLLYSVTPGYLLLSSGVLIGGAMAAHYVLRQWRGVEGNIESTVVTALILTLILTPATGTGEALILASIAALAIVGKFFIARKYRHIFNPAALALFIVGLVGYSGVEWWVGSRYMLPIVLVMGSLVTIKTRRVGVSLVYIITSAMAVTMSMLVLSLDTSILDTLIRHITSWATIFIATIMITEPMGLPAKTREQYLYATIAGVLGGIPFSIGFLHGTPEFAILAANLFTLVVNGPSRVMLAFIGKTQVGKDIYEYRFRPSSILSYSPGQYMEWSIPHPSPDNRGIRRFLTIASDPGDVTLSFAVRHVENESSWKKTLAKLNPGDVISAAHVSGDFILDKDVAHHVFVAGGIGITPFIAMIRATRRTGAPLNATLFYATGTEKDIAFRDEFKDAKEIGLTIVHVFAKDEGATMAHETGFLTPEMITRHVPDANGATFYLSGPSGMVTTYKGLLQGMGIPMRKIITDYFPGLA